LDAKEFGAWLRGLNGVVGAKDDEEGGGNGEKGERRKRKTSERGIVTGFYVVMGSLQVGFSKTHHHYHQFQFQFRLPLYHQ
jgi:hypothetical protein